MFEAVETLLAEHAELERRLSDPAIHADQAEARKVGRRYAELGQVVSAYEAWKQTNDDLSAARELGSEDASFAEEAERLAERLDQQEQALRLLLLPRDPNEDKNVILEIKAGEGGAESALFAGDLLRMYTRYAERQNWKTEVMDAADSDLGGVKSVTLAVKGKASADSGTPYARLQFEGGVHRVQRVPVTDSAVRITHLPTGIVVSCQNEKSQLQNKEQALRILRARLLQQAQEAADAEASAARRSQVRTVDRSERIRTYNFPQNRITDHRVGYTAYNLDHVLDGELDGVVDALITADQQERLTALEGSG